MNQLQEQITEQHKYKRSRLSDNLNETNIKTDQRSEEYQISQLVISISKAAQDIEKLERSNADYARQIITLARKMNSEQIRSTFDLQFFVEIAAQFNEFKTKTEFELLDVFEIVAKCVVEQQKLKYKKNFSKIFAKSGLHKRIEDGIKLRIPDEYNDDQRWMIENDTFQFTLIFCYLTSFSDYDHQLCLYCRWILQENLQSLINSIESCCKNIINLKKNKDKEEKELTEYVENIKKLLTALKYTTKDNNIRVDFFQDIDIEEEVVPFFHIRCPPSLKCPNCIVFPKYIDAVPIHLLVLKILAQYQEFLDGPELFHIDPILIVNHLAPKQLAQIHLYNNLLNPINRYSFDQKDSAFIHSQISEVIEEEGGFEEFDSIDSKKLE